MRSSRRRGPRSSRARPGRRSPASRHGPSGCSPRSPGGGARPAGAGRASRGTPPSSGNEAHGSSQPPSTHTIPRTSSGARRASSRTTLPPHDWPATTGRSSPSSRISGAHVVRDGRHVVRAVGLGGAAVAAEVDRDGEVAAVAELARDAVPHPGVRREAVDEHERHRAGGEASRAPTCRRPAPRRGRRGHAACASDEYRRGGPAHGGARTASALVVRQRQPEPERRAAARRSCRPRSRSPSPPGAGS